MLTTHRAPSIVSLATAVIGDFINAASADVMTFASKLTYETFLQQTTHLSETEQVTEH